VAGIVKLDDAGLHLAGRANAAARALYAGHSVDAISRHDAGARNLRVTSRSVKQIIETSRQGHRKAIVFVTGVPGAGKTLVGLDLASCRHERDNPAHAVYLSGNGPLVAVLREALTRDEWARRKLREPRIRKGVIAQEVKPFIQNVHHFRDEGVRNQADAPFDRVVIFDEAQRAWNQRKTSDFMRRRKKVAGFDMSEPEFLLSYMDRHRDWAVVVCLVGGGQEIHDGEAGIAAWLDAVRDRFPEWEVHVSPEMTDSEYAAGRALDSLEGRAHVTWDRGLHLAVSMRSFRSERLSSFVKAVLDREVAPARASFRELQGRYPIVVTRDLDRARDWIRSHGRGSERYGLLASSQAQRLKPHAIDVRVNVDPVQYFLSPVTDTRSSNYLEDAATEFQVQGLELDWTCVTWDADLRSTEGGWAYHSFRGDRWEQVRQAERQRYLLNAYRVLLTRARQGMVIFVPPACRRIRPARRSSTTTPTNTCEGRGSKRCRRASTPFTACCGTRATRPARRQLPSQRDLTPGGTRRHRPGRGPCGCDRRRPIFLPFACGATSSGPCAPVIRGSTPRRSPPRAASPRARWSICSTRPAASWPVESGTRIPRSASPC
jgi:hypothetical protein